MFVRPSASLDAGILASVGNAASAPDGSAEGVYPNCSKEFPSWPTGNLGPQNTSDAIDGPVGTFCDENADGR